LLFVFIYLAGMWVDGAAGGGGWTHLESQILLFNMRKSWNWN